VFLKIFIYIGETLVSLNWALVNDILLVTVYLVHFACDFDVALNLNIGILCVIRILKCTFCWTQQSAVKLL